MNRRRFIQNWPTGLKVLSSLLPVFLLTTASVLGQVQGKPAVSPAPSRSGIPPMNKSNSESQLEMLWGKVRRFPNSAEAHNDFGVALGDSGDWDAALAELQTATRLKPDYAQA